MKSDIENSKKQLRKLFSEKRNADGYSELKTAAEEKISDFFCSLSEYKNAENILLYSALKKEISTERILKKSLTDGKGVYFPKSYDKGIMEFFRVRSESDFTVGKFGISEPSGSEKYVKSDGGICVVPAFSFSSDGFRLGFGGGYYDRFLAEFKGFSVGLCLSGFLSDSIPRDNYDIAVNAVITEKGVIRVK